MTDSEAPLVAKLKRILRYQDAAAVPAEPPPVLSPRVSEKLRQCENLVKKGEVLLLAIADSVALLEAACTAAGIVSGEPPIVSPALAPRLPALTALVREDKAAGMAVASVLMQDRAARLEVASLQEALAQGRLDDIHVERSKGKFFYLIKVHHSFRPFPLLADLFDATPLPGIDMAMGTAPIGSFVAGGPDRQPSREELLVTRGKALLKELEFRIFILRAAVNDVVPNRISLLDSLPPPAQQTALQLAALLHRDEALLRRVSETVQHFHEARLVIQKRPLVEPERLRDLLATLGSLPRRMRGTPLLEHLFSDM